MPSTATHFHSSPPALPPFPLQVHFRPTASYMNRQPDLTHNMRSILVDWLQEVAEEYQLTMDTLALAVAYLDRFLSKMSVSRSKLQLLGATCMYLAAKFEEIYPPEIAEFVYITDDTYTKRQVSKSRGLANMLTGMSKGWACE